MNFNDFISNLQKKPYSVRLRILWISTAVAAVILVVVWIFTVKSGIDQLSGQDLFDDGRDPTSNQNTIVEESDYIMIERVANRNDGAFQIFFKIKNPTDDILNFSSSDEIELQIKEKRSTPIEILDRQTNPFVKKILSNTEKFGILVFSDTEEDEGTLTFNNLFFEQNSTTLLKEVFELDFKKLNQVQELRN